jgi:hypothetical protein
VPETDGSSVGREESRTTFRNRKRRANPETAAMASFDFEIEEETMHNDFVKLRSD